jgi:hypothetical protein
MDVIQIEKDTKVLLLDRFAVQGLFYWISILSLILLGVPRFVYVLYTWYYTKNLFIIPKEIYFWLIMFCTFPICLHVIAGYSEVQLNKRRKRAFGDKISFAAQNLKKQFFAENLPSQQFCARRKRNRKETRSESTSRKPLHEEDSFTVPLFL